MATTQRQTCALPATEVSRALTDDASDNRASLRRSSEEEPVVDSSARKTTRRKSTTQPKAKRQKAKAAEAESQPARDEEEPVVAKAFKRRRGKDLSLLVTMPLDILFEILSFLSPKDLLSVIRTNKLFYKTLLAPNAKCVWIAAREPAGVPEPPEDFSEARWAGLIFKSICQSCSSTNVKIDWMLRRRICTACKRRHLVYAKRKFPANYPDYDAEILDYILHTNGKLPILFTILQTLTIAVPVGSSARRPSNSKYYWDEDIEAVWEKWSSLKTASSKGLVGAKDAFEGWKEERLAWVTENIELSKFHSEWYHDMVLKSERESNMKAKQDRIQRLAGFRQRFLEAGYTGVDVDGALSVQTYGIRQGVPHVTNAVWNMCKPGLERLVIAKKEARLNKELGDIVKPRMKIFKALYESYLAELRPSQRFQSPAYQLMRTVPDVAALIDADRKAVITARDFQPVVAQISEHISQYLNDDREALTSAIPSTDFKEGVDPLNMARFVFQCKAFVKRQGTSSWLGIPCMVENKCPSILLVGWNMVVSHLHADCVGAAACEDGVIPAALPRHAVTLNANASVRAETLIALCGLDPMTATLFDMDSKGSLLVCTNCTFSQAKIYPLYNWRQAIRHISTSHSYFYSGDPRSVLFRLATTEETEKAGSASGMLDRAHIWSCDHCSLLPVSGKTAVLTHIQAQHNIAQPELSKDYVLHEKLRRKMAPFQYETTPPPQTHQQYYQCLRCTDDSQKNRWFQQSGVVLHIQEKHKIQQPKSGDDYQVDRSISDPSPCVAKPGSANL